MNLVTSAATLQPGDYLINIGTIESVVTYHALRTVEVFVQVGPCLSCFFYWFTLDTKVNIIRK